VPSNLPQKVIDQMKKAGLPQSGTHPFKPRLKRNRKGDFIIDTRAPKKKPKSGKPGFVDEQGRIWIRDRAHAKLPDHWDVQIDDGDDYMRIDSNGEEVLTS
jgi:hypothetical protein